MNNITEIAKQFGFTNAYLSRQDINLLIQAIFNKMKDFELQKQKDKQRINSLEQELFEREKDISLMIGGYKSYQLIVEDIKNFCLRTKIINDSSNDQEIPKKLEQFFEQNSIFKKKVNSLADINSTCKKSEINDNLKQKSLECLNCKILERRIKYQSSQNETKPKTQEVTQFQVCDQCPKLQKQLNDTISVCDFKINFLYQKLAAYQERFQKIENQIEYLDFA